MKPEKRTWLILARMSRGMTQAEVAIELEMPQTTYSSYENGTRMYSGKAALKMSRFFEIPLERFFEDKRDAKAG